MGVLRLYHLSFNYMENCALSELRGVLEHPRALSLVTALVRAIVENVRNVAL